MNKLQAEIIELFNKAFQGEKEEIGEQICAYDCMVLTF
jgi:hypothetical protein